MDFSPYLAIVIGLALFSIGLMLGYILALHLQRRSSGGKLASEIKADLDAYREEVTEHFSATSDLFQTLTEQYRALYDHLSHGARDLCSPEPGTPELELPERGLLTRGKDEPSASDQAKPPAAQAPTERDGDSPGAEAPAETQDDSRRGQPSAKGEGDAPGAEAPAAPKGDSDPQHRDPPKGHS